MIKQKRAINRTTIYWDNEKPKSYWTLVFEDIATYDFAALCSLNIFHGIKDRHIENSALSAKRDLLVDDMAQLSLNLSNFLDLASKNAVLQNRFVMRDARKLNNDILELLNWMHSQP